MAIVALSALVAACGGSDGAEPHAEAFGVVFRGALIADEPTAAAVGGRVLDAGGSAADAVVATALALTVTYPVAVGLGGGGTCLAYDGSRVETLEFPTAAAGAVMLPGMVRGLLALHARYGRQRWSQVVAPAEALARFGAPVSRALRVALDGNGMRLQGVLAQRLMPAGTPRAEGETLVWPEVAQALDRLRRSPQGAIGARGWYDDLQRGWADLGVRVDPEALAAHVPKWQAREAIRHGGFNIHAGTDAAAANLWVALARAYRDADPGDRPALLANGAPASAFAATHASAGLSAVVAIEAGGSAAACLFGLGAPFGTGRLVPGTAIVDAAGTVAPGPGPILVTNRRVNELYLAGVGVGPDSTLALTAMVLDLFEIGAPLERSLARPRLAAGPGAGRVRAEPGQTAEAARALAGAGVEVAPAPALGRLTVGICRAGLRAAPRACEYRADPRGYGVGVGGS